MRVIGKKINNMDKVSRHGQMVQDMRDSMFKVKNTAKASLLGLMAPLITVNL